MATRLAVFGFGNIGSAVVSGAIAARVLEPAEIIVIEPDATRRADAVKLGCSASELPNDASSAPDVLLAVKPQTFADLATSLRARTARAVFISVMAGLSGKRLRDALGVEHAIVRAMPNTPCRVGLGMTAIALSAGAKRGDDAMAEKLFSAVGHVVRVEEAMLDAITAVSGSGPAYLFFVAEAWENAAIDLGFDRETARELVRQTIVGAARMLEDRAADAADLRAAVTSKGGTTAAAVALLEDRDVRGALKAALAAAQLRSREIGD